MPDLEETDLDQTAVLWTPTGVNTRYGQPALNAPVEIPIRWVKKQKEVAGPKGMNLSYDATAVVNRYVPTHSHIWLGTLSEWYGQGSAGQPDQLMEVIYYNSTPDIKNRNQRREIGMMRLRDKA